MEAGINIFTFMLIVALSVQGGSANTESVGSTVAEETQSVGYTVKTDISKNVADMEGTKVNFTITVNYPEIGGNGEATNIINNAIAEDIRAKEAAYKTEYGLEPGEIVMDDPIWRDLSSTIDYDIKQLDDEIISMYITETIDLAGAHPITIPSGLTFNLKTGERMKADDFIPDAADKGLSGVKEMAQNDPVQYMFYDEETFTLTDEQFYIEGNELVFFIPQYEIAPYARGIVEYRLNIE